MKTLFALIILLLFVLNLHSQIIISDNIHNNTELIDSLARYCARDLGIDTAHIEICFNSTDFDKYNNGEYATVRTTDNKLFVINLQNNLGVQKIKRVIIHEMFHVYQFVKKELAIRSYCVYYKGTTYTNDSDYLKREYEIAAFKYTHDFQKAHKTELNSMIKILKTKKQWKNLQAYW